MSDRKRYRLICVAPEVPDKASTDDRDEALANADAHWEPYDTLTGKFLYAGEEEVMEARERLKQREVNPLKLSQAIVILRKRNLSGIDYLIEKAMTDIEKRLVALETRKDCKCQKPE